MQKTDVEMVRLEQQKLRQSFEALKMKKGIKKDSNKFLAKKQEMLRR